MDGRRGSRDGERADAARTRDDDEPRVLVLRPEGCSVAAGGAVLLVRRAMITPGHAIEGCRAILESARAHPRGIVMLNVFRLSPEFPIQAGFDAHLGELASALRSIEPVVAASADVLELRGVRAAVMRAAARTVWAIAKPRAPRASFDRLSDAIDWLAPHARAVGAPDDPASYVRLFRFAEASLDALDAARGARTSIR